MPKGPVQTYAARRRRHAAQADEVYQPNPCLFPGCKRGIYLRGNCKSHYTQIDRGIKKGQFTWDDLMKHGLAFKAKNQ